MSQLPAPVESCALLMATSVEGQEPHTVVTACLVVMIARLGEIAQRARQSGNRVHLEHLAPLAPALREAADNVDSAIASLRRGLS